MTSYFLVNNRQEKGATLDTFKINERKLRLRIWFSNILDWLWLCVHITLDQVDIVRSQILNLFSVFYTFSNHFTFRFHRRRHNRIQHFEFWSSEPIGSTNILSTFKQRIPKSCK